VRAVSAPIARAILEADMPGKNTADLLRENEELRGALEDAQETIHDALYSDDDEDIEGVEEEDEE
jgi:hypothetical protein